MLFYIFCVPLMQLCCSKRDFKGANFNFSIGKVKIGSLKNPSLSRLRRLKGSVKYKAVVSFSGKKLQIAS